MKKQNKKISCREAAYLAYLNSQRAESFISDSLIQWKNSTEVLEKDYRLAQEIAFGTCRMAAALEFYAKQLTDKKLTLKRKERCLLHTALYQFFFLDKIPLYAITNESISISKKYCHNTFTKFLNAVLRKLPSTKLTLPSNDSINSLAIRNSYPTFFVEQLIKSYGLEQAKDILHSGNLPGKVLARVRCKEPTLEKFENNQVNMVHVENSIDLHKIANTPDYYIQNITPVLLLNTLAQNLNPPSSILDLCSSPGGKLIACHDLYPNSKLFANDISPHKLEILKKNLHTYSIKATVTEGPGQDYSTHEKFDLIILDVPCSNSGVLNKRPEARWRLSTESLKDLNTTQVKLLNKAKDLLSEKGEIWFMTCSILPEENEKLIETFAKENQFNIRTSKMILPSSDGYDGGFACALSRS
ncbi:MAG: transcription antitermination factor NusB [Chlamydiota bacterium]|nr:transcription antitermination factor NusB [Chlamydiota bacterium]